MPLSSCVCVSMWGEPACMACHPVSHLMGPAFTKTARHACSQFYRMHTMSISPIVIVPLALLISKSSSAASQGASHLLPAKFLVSAGFQMPNSILLELRLTHYRLFMGGACATRSKIQSGGHWPHDPATPQSTPHRIQRKRSVVGDHLQGSALCADPFYCVAM